jgi:gluconolactonase
MKMRWSIQAVTLMTCIAAACVQAQDRHQAVERIVERVDGALDRLVAPDAIAENVADGFGFTEGPVWENSTASLLFSDVPGNVVYRYTPATRKTVVYMYRAGFQGADPWRWGGMSDNGRDDDDPRFERFPMLGPDGLALDASGRLILCTFAGRSIDRIEKDGRRTVLADTYEGKRFNGTNDVVVRRDGSIYFTDTFGGLRDRGKDRRKELPFNGVYRWSEGKLTLLISDMANTNGLAFSPDEKYLYVNASRDNYVNRYDVLPDGTLTHGQLFIDFRGKQERGVTDGMKVDVDGNVYVTGPGGIWILSPEAQHLGTIHLPEVPINLAFGDVDRKSLYVTAHSGLYRVRLKIAGI